MRVSRKAGHRGGDREHVNNCLEGQLAAPLTSKRTCLPSQCQAAPAHSPALTCAHLPTGVTCLSRPAGIFPGGLEWTLRTRGPDQAQRLWDLHLAPYDPSGTPQPAEG